MGQLLHCNCPSLHTLTIGCDNDTSLEISTIHLQIDRFPLLRALHLDGIWPDFSEPPASVNELVFSCGPREDWPLRLHLVQSCHLIQRLTIDLKWCFSPGLIPFPATKLPSLIYLEFRGIRELTADSISPFLGCCDVPNLESLVIRSGLLTAGMGESLCQSMVRSRSRSYHARF